MIWQNFLMIFYLNIWLDLIRIWLDSKSSSWGVWIWFKYSNLGQKPIRDFVEILQNFSRWGDFPQQFFLLISSRLNWLGNGLIQLKKTFLAKNASKT